uniref:Uncharacterized protein n=1 Tax=Arundo donax TaxID=35708 RepID=A0A0A9CHW7_ARUDO
MRLICQLYLLYLLLWACRIIVLCIGVKSMDKKR